MHRLEDIERQEEKESGSVETKLERRLEIEFGLKKSTGGNFRVITIVVSLCQQIQTVIPTTFKEISENHGRLHSQLARTGVVSLYLWMQSKVESREWLLHVALLRIEYLLLGRSRSGVRAGVGVVIIRPESESESE